jgi:hypothetical protein
LQIRQNTSLRHSRSRVSDYRESSNMRRIRDYWIPGSRYRREREVFATARPGMTRANYPALRDLAAERWVFFGARRADPLPRA